ncbi:MAG: hypothetical protein MUF19_00555 [Candidatus Pacebacteria bacterium]|jgi:hypothetical protein|nr:hypothetical protein [Candidatus Paceibacterota bacterium]
MLFAFGSVPTALAAFPVVQSTSSGGNTAVGLSTAITLPSGVTNGDLLMVFFIKDGTAAPTSTVGTGWTALNGGAGTAQYSIGYWKIADGSDTLTINHASSKTAYVAYRITGHDPNTAPTEATAVTGTSVSPNPPSLNPAGWDIEDTLWISSFGWDRLGAAASNLSAYPTNYSGSQTSFVSGATANDVAMAASTRNLQIASEDPGTATLSQSVAWIARTYAVRPVPTLTLSGTLFTDAGITPESTVKTIAVAVGTSTPGRFSSTSVSSTGAWSVTLPAGHGVTAGTPIMIWVDGDSGFRATLVTKASSTDNITGLDLYEDRVILRHEGTSATSTTNNDLSFFTAAQDSDLQHSTSSTGIVIHSPNQLYVWSGDTFAPGGNVTIAGNGGSGATEGSFFLATSSMYTAGGELRLAGSLSAISGVTINNATGTLRFIATTTGKTINAPVTSLGNVTFDGVGGAWLFSSAATTSAFTILRGAVTAPATTLGVTGVFQNDGTFNHNNGTVNIVGAASQALSDFSTFVAGRDASGSGTGSTGSDFNDMAVSTNGQTLYVVASAGVSTACSQTVGSAQFCELLVFNIASTTNPIFVAGRDSSGSAAGTSTVAMRTAVVSGNFLYIGKEGDATTCSQIAGQARGCELMVFDISSTTNPVYVAGRDRSGLAAGTADIGIVITLNVKGNALYVTQTGSGNCSQTASLTNICDLAVYDISSSTNPTYIAGRNIDGSATGSASGVMYATVAGDVLYVGVSSLSAAPCSQTAGSASSCELQVYDISSTTNPVYVAGRDVDGSASGATDSSLSSLVVHNNFLYVSGGESNTACGQTAGSATGCRLQVYDISSTTNPQYVRGVGISGSENAVDVSVFSDLHVQGNYLYAVQGISPTARMTCSQYKGVTAGCELIIFDISSSTALRHIGGKDASGSATGTSLQSTLAVTSVGGSLYVTRESEPTACSQTVGSAIGCELQVYDISRMASGILQGNMSGSNALYDVNLTGVAEIRDSASARNFTIVSGTTTAPETLTLTGDFTNNANFVAREGSLVMSASSSQSITGNLTNDNALYELVLAGTGTKTLDNQASTTYLEVGPGVTLNTPALVSVSGAFLNNGSLASAGDTIILSGLADNFIAGLSTAGSMTDTSGFPQVNDYLRVGTTLYVIKSGAASACSEIPGFASACELLVLDISSSTNPRLVAARDVSGSATGTASVAMNSLAISADETTLYIAKANSATACSQNIGLASGCELMVFDISSTTNPIFVAGRDVSGSATGSGSANIRDIAISGNFLYAASGGTSGTCSQTIGSATPCDLLVFDISSSTNPTFVAARDADGTATGAVLANATSIAISSTTLYLSKFASGATACNTTASNCELMIFNIASGTNPVYVGGRDSSASAAGTNSQSLNSIVASNNRLYVAKAGDATACSQTAGSALGCEMLVFDISSTTNPVYVSGRDSGGSSNGTQDIAANFVTAYGNLVFLAKDGSVTACSQTVGSARGCEVLVFDVSSSTNPLYVKGIDSAASTFAETETAVQTVYVQGDMMSLGKAGNARGCEQGTGLRIGCEIMLFQLPATLSGGLTGGAALPDLITEGIVSIKSNASTSNVVVASSSTLVAPTSTLSIAGDFTVRGNFEHNNGQVSFSGTNQSISTFATTTFYDLVQIATTSATTTFSTNAPFLILRNLNLQGVATATPLRLRSVTAGTQWRINPYSTTTATLLHLDVQDSNNISATATPLVCGAGCRDGGNNLNWTLGLQYTLSGILYREDGVTPYATATPIRLVIPLASTYFQTATSASTTGVYSMTVSESFLATSTPYFLFADNAVGIDANTIVKSSSTIASISSLDLYRDHIILRTEGGTSTPITSEDLALYNLTSDNDLRYTVDSSLGVQVLSPNALVVWDNSSFAPKKPVTVIGTSSTTPTVGSMYLRSGAQYSPESQTSLAGSFRASSTATYNPGLTVMEFTATTTGKVIDSQLATLGSVRFDGASGAWTFTQANATTSDFIIERGSVTAPSGVLTTTGVFVNNATFANNNGMVRVVGNVIDDNTRAVTFVAGLDNQGRKTGNGAQSIESLHLSGNYLYRGTNSNSNACTQTAGTGVVGCDIAVFDISSSTNPVYVAGLDADGSANGTTTGLTVADITSKDNYLFIIKTGTTTSCGQVPGTGFGCELMVFDITDPTNPVYVAGRDMDGSAAGGSGTNGNTLEIVGNYLYVGKGGSAVACSQVAGSAGGCELMVFDITDPTNPVYVAGRDASGSLTGTAGGVGILDMDVQGNNLYITKQGDATACNQTIGSAIGCELMVFSVASTTNPTLVRALDALGTNAGTLNLAVESIHTRGNLMVIGKNADVTACAQVAASSQGCEIAFFDISSSTNPVYVAGRDVDGDNDGTGGLDATKVYLHGNNLYVGKEGQVTPCSQTVGFAQGCDLQVYDVSSTTNPIYVAGRDNSGSLDGDQARTINTIVARDEVIYVGKNGNTTNCVQTTAGTGAIGCELMVYTSFQPAGILSGNLTAGNSLSTLETRNITELAVTASTTNISIATSSLLTAQNVSLTGNFSNSGTFSADDGTTFLASSSVSQNFTGTPTSSATFSTLAFRGGGTKNLNINATTTDFIVPTSVTVTYSNDLSINRSYINSGTVSATLGSELVLTGENPIGAYIAGRDGSASAAGVASAGLNQTLRSGNYLYVTRFNNGTACSQTAGGAQGCELQVYDVSSSTNPIYVAGRDASGSAAGTGAVNAIDMVIAGTFLYLTKAGDATACSQVAGSAIGCELMVFDISSSTNPIYVAGRDASGSAAGTGVVNIPSLNVVGNHLYAFKVGDATACSQVAGSAIGCEFMIFDITNPTNPIYVAGRDSSGNNVGTSAFTIVGSNLIGDLLYITKDGDATACSQVAGSAIGCELQIYDVSSSTNPIYVSGLDTSGDSSGTGVAAMRRSVVRGNYLYVAKNGDATACSQTAGGATGCELMVFDISSSTNPIYVAGRDASGDSVGTGNIAVNDVLSNTANNLYIVKVGDATACSQVAGSAIGCEIMVFDVSSSTNPIYTVGVDTSGSASGAASININDLTLSGNNAYITKSGDATACSQVAGSAIGCELMVFNTGTVLQGNMIGASAHNVVTAQGPIEWYHNASTTDLVIAVTGDVTLPSEFSLGGDFTNNGLVNAINSTVTLVGNDQVLTSSATTTFKDLIQVATTSATTTFSSTGAFVSTGMLRLQGTAAGRLKLRSTVDGLQWTILPQGTTSVAWLDVHDSNNASSTIIECSDNCINRGNTTNWIFFSPLGTGTSTLKAHAAGQIGNAFGAATSTDEELLAFQIETNSGSTTFSNLVFGLQGVSGVNEGDLTNFRLVQDRNSNRSYDAGDILVGGIGDVTWSGDSAVVGFYEPFEATTTRNYVVVADVAPIANGSFLTIGIGPNGISAIDSTGAQTILGTAISFQHSRNNRGGGGNSASIGGAAPDGDGDVGGGDTTGGEQIGSDPDFFWPTSNSGSWINGAFAYDGIDGTYATTSTANNHNFTNHGFGIPGGNTIGGIEVKLELSGTTPAGSVDVQLSWDGGSSWTSSKNSGTLTTADAVRTLGSPSDLWGRAWTPAEFSNPNFAVRLAGSPSSNIIRVDAIQVRIYHVTSGGGGGGGGGGAI